MPYKVQHLFILKSKTSNYFQKKRNKKNRASSRHTAFCCLEELKNCIISQQYLVSFLKLLLLSKQL